MRGHLLLFSLLALLLVVFQLFQVEAKILTQCEAAKELQKAGISKTYISNWVCLMKSESGLDTKLVKGPGSLSSFSYGVFQISSIRWCKRGRKGGDCNAKCEDFANDDITDDIACANFIFNTAGWDNWQGWKTKCKGKPLPDMGSCKSRRSAMQRFISLLETSTTKLIDSEID